MSTYYKAQKQAEKESNEISYKRLDQVGGILTETVNIYESLLTEKNERILDLEILVDKLQEELESVKGSLKELEGVVYE